jgi:hypothetical protein
MAFRPRDIREIYQAQKVGLIVLQFKGSAPAVSTVVGAIALDAKDGRRYINTVATGWTVTV